MSGALNLKYALLFFNVLLLQDLSLCAQPKFVQNPVRIPVYRSVADSVKLNEIEQAIHELERSAVPQIKASDSLIALYRKLYSEAILGIRKVYFPDRDYVTLDSLEQMSDPLAVRKITVYDYSSKDLPSVILQCKNLVSLELIQTNIRRLPESLQTLTHLEEIKIYNHRGRRLKLKKNQFVKHLVVSGSTARALPRSYRSFSGLEKLDLAGNWLKRFPQGARHNRNLRELNLQDNQITFKQPLKKHPYVETLALQHNRITNVPASIRSFNNLKKLNFNYNKITDVHRSIRLLTRLEHLSFYNNRLTSIPEGIYGLRNLRELDLFYNAIETLDERIAQWKHLRMLYLSHNKILSLPESIGQLSSLEGLYIWDNRISALPGTLGDIQTLRFLWVNNNNLSSLPESIFDMERVEELDLSHNFLTEIPDLVFEFKYLKILSLLNNPWNPKSTELILRRTPELRSKNVFVHIPEK